MDFSSLSKQQKDRLMLTIMLSVLILVGIGYGVSYGLSLGKDFEAKNEKLADTIRRAERTVKRRRSVKKKLEEATKKLNLYLKESPPPKSYYAWATELIYAMGEECKFKIDAIDKLDHSKLNPQEMKKKQISLKVSSLKIRASSEYSTTIYFLEKLEKKYPLARIVSVSITAASDPEIHNVEIVVQWPFNLAYVLRGTNMTKGASK